MRMNLLQLPVPRRTRSRWRTVRAVACVLACLAAPAVSAQPLFRFDFNEGSGQTVTNESGSLVGLLGLPVDEAAFPVTADISPTGGPADKSVTIVPALGYLLANATNAPALHDLTQPITAEAWIFLPEYVAQPQGITGYGTSWKLGILGSGNLAFTLFGVADINSGVFVDVGAWTHVAASWEPGVGVRFFINGAEVNFVAETRPMRAPGNPYLGVGAAGFNGEPLLGSVDRLRVHRAVLAAEALDSVAATPKPAVASTAAAFDFGEAQAPYKSTGTLTLDAVPAQPIQIAARSPQFTNDTPSGLEGDTALSFDGNDLLTVDDLGQVLTLPDGNFTIQAWIKFDTLPQARSILLGNFGPGGAVSFSVTSARELFVTTYGIADTRSAALVPNDGLWHHVAVIHRNGQDLRFYVDGVLGDTIAYTGGLQTRDNTYFNLGSELGSTNPYRGLMDRMQVSSVAMDPKDLDFLAIPGVEPDAPELTIGTAVSVSWPTAATGFILQSTATAENPASWTNVTTAPVVIGDTFYSLLPALETKTFFRLVRPEGD